MDPAAPGAHELWADPPPERVRWADLPHLVASQLYTGRQHTLVVQGVERLRQRFGPACVDLRIVSAGFGLVSEDDLVPPYDATFAGLGKGRSREIGANLGLPLGFQQALGSSYDLALVLLGESYLQAVHIHTLRSPGIPLIVFGARSVRREVPRWLRPGVLVVGAEDASAYGAGLIAVKGKLFSLLAERLAECSATQARQILLDVAGTPAHLWTLLARYRRPSRQYLPGSEEALSRRAVVAVTTASEAPRPRNTGIPFRYFIPDWNDRVDPDYDFEQDRPGAGRKHWHDHDVYAHELYPRPNYDGVLVSRMVLLGGAVAVSPQVQQQRRAQVTSAGSIGRYLRLPPDSLVMGDCGAFGYRTMAKPPITTEDVLAYYRDLRFDLGVSVDHLVFAGRTRSEQEARYALTLENARTFLRLAAEQGMPMGFMPVGAAQGWATEPESYADAVRALVQMGYRYIALGGLVRAPTSGILRILERVSPLLPEGVGLHLFGIARPDAIPRFRSYGVTSLDSASPLRRAWMDGRKNYFTLTDAYVAIRVPAARKGASASLLALEHTCLDSLRRIGEDRLVGETDRRQAINAALVYQEARADEQGGTPPDVAVQREQYDRMLRDRPWEECGCVICRNLGIEVVLFRGNDRNRRRGFHNTYIFYQQLQTLLEPPFPDIVTNLEPQLVGSAD